MEAPEGDRDAAVIHEQGFSSVWPLQLSSMLLPQISGDGAPGVHEFAEQLVPVRWHAPTPQVASGMPSSTTPLQLSSTPLQVSAVGGPAVHEFAEQLVPVRWHAPTPQVASGMPSSTTPSQLSSTPLHDSAVGGPGVQVTAPE